MPDIRQYKDYLVELRNFDIDTNTYQVALTLPKGMGEPAPAAIQLNIAEIETDLRDLEDKDIWVEDLISLGKRLMDRLLPEGDLRNHLIRAVKELGQNDGVRLRLHIRESTLQQLPWEYCYLKIHEGKENRNHFLVLHPKISLVRHPPIDEPIPHTEAKDPKNLRMLAAFANPESPDFRKLKLKTETRVLQKALGEFEVEGVNIAWEPLREDITLEGLNKYLLEKPDIFHFSGHGVFKAMDDTGSLVLLEDVERKKPDFLPAPDLAKKLQVAGVRLAMLGACESGRQHGNTPWTAIAPALVSAGIPAVVAMQFEVEDAKAILFSQGFYTTLAAGLSIDEAVTNGRLAVLEKSDEKGVEWGVPTLYMRGDGLIFSKIARPETELAGLIRNSVNQIVDEVAKGGELIGMEFKKGARPGHYIVVQKIKIVKGKVVGQTFDSL